MSRARVLIASDRVAALPAIDVGVALAKGFADVADVAVVPLATGGSDLASVFAWLTQASVEGDHDRWYVDHGDAVLIGATEPAAPKWSLGGSGSFGAWVREVVDRTGARRLIVDLTGLTGLDGGAGLLDAAESALRGREVIGIIADDEVELPATGLTGAVARRGYGAGAEVAEVLAADAVMRTRAAALGDDVAGLPGAGAGGGCGMALLSVGGRLITGPQLLGEQARVESSIAAADLVVTATGALSALDRGGPVTQAVIGWADAALRPCIAFCGGEELSRREVRTFGLEAAHAITAPITAEALRAAARRVALSWFG